MALVIKDRVRETTTTTGTGTITLAGAVTGYQSFGTAIGSTNTTFYTIAGQGTSEWEVGLGTVGSGTLARTTVLASSNSGSAVNFSAGTKDVFGTYPAGRAVASTGALTSGRVTYATTDGAVTDSANLTFNGTTLTTANDASISTLTVGRGGGSVATNTALGVNALIGTNTGIGYNTAIGYQTLQANTTGFQNTAIGSNILTANISGTRNTAIGNGALYSNTTNNNLAIGFNAATSNTTGSVVAIGYQTLQANTTGTRNIGIGGFDGGNNSSTLYYNTTGGSNLAIGFSCMFNNTIGSNNIALGYGTLYNNTSTVATLGAITGGSGYTNGTYNAVALTLSSGSAAGTYPTANITVSGGAVTAVTLVTFGTRFVDTTTVLTCPAASIGGTGSGFSVPVATLATGGNNTAVGYQALNANTSASSNAAFGYRTLVANTTGSNNTGFGNQALVANTTGSQNTAIGYNAGISITTNSFSTYIGGSAGNLNTGGNNTAIGQSALSASGAGTDNTAIGMSTLNALTSGTQNTAIGKSAGASGTNNLTTGSNNIIIGYNAAASSASVSNEITLGNSSITSLRTAPLIHGYTSAAPTIASAATIAPTKPISFVSGTTTIDTITAPAPLTGGGGKITIIPTGLWSTSTAGNIALATTAVVSKALILFYDSTSGKWYPSY